MRICPKCRNFYADETLKFCPADGVPLIGVDPSGKLWPEGTEAVRKTANRVQREIRRQKLKKILSMTVTTVLVIMVISVVTLNSYIYLNPEEKEIAQAIPPAPDPVVEEAPSPTPVSWIDTILGTPTPTPDEGGGPPRTPTPPLTPSPSIYVPPTPDEIGGTPPMSPTPPLTPTPIVVFDTPPPSGCSLAEKGMAILAIRNEYINAWKNEIRESEESSVKQRYSKEVNTNGRPVRAILSFSMFSPVIVPDKECKSASARIAYAWSVGMYVGNTFLEPQKYGGSRSYRCVNNGGNWACP